MQSISIIIPCHNESGAIPIVMKSLKELLDEAKQKELIQNFEVIVVNDASTDSTADLLGQHSWAQIIHLKKNSGYGEALKRGFQRAKYEWIAFFDLDGTYDPKDLEASIYASKIHRPDLIFGERFSLGKGMPLVRAFGNRAFTYIVSVLFSSSLKDVCTGFRLFHSKHKAEILSLSSSGLDFSLAVTLWALKSKKKVIEIPIQYHLRSGKSKLRVFPDGNRFLWTILRAHFSVGFP